MSFQATNLSFAYDNGVKFVFPDVSLASQENALIVGKSGVGKTTLLHILGGLLKPQSGSVLINSESVYHDAPSKTDLFRGQNIGFIFQQNHLLAALNVFENIAIAAQIAKKHTPKADIEKLIHQLDLAEHQHKKPSQLSIGQQQRVAIARALVTKPALILADEPTSALDDENTHNVMQLLFSLAQQQNSNLITVTHDARIKPFFNQIITLS